MARAPCVGHDIICNMCLVQISILLPCSVVYTQHLCRRGSSAANEQTATGVSSGWPATAFRVSELHKRVNVSKFQPAHLPPAEYEYGRHFVSTCLNWMSNHCKHTIDNNN